MPFSKGPGAMASFALAVVLSILFCARPADSFTPTRMPNVHTRSTSSLRVASFGFDATEEPSPDEDHPNRVTEFSDLEPVTESLTRQARMKEELKTQHKYVKYGDDLWTLRNVMNSLSQKLVSAINDDTKEKEERIRSQLRQIEGQDPELVYKMELEQLRKALRESRSTDAAQHSEDALAARSCLPQFNLEGLWVGKYGHHGYEMINITYHDDTLIAYKVTGDKNVPKGEITFQVELNPLPQQKVGGGVDPANAPLQPITLTEKAAQKWGTTQLPRYKGTGQVAEQGFSNNQWMDGQLIIIGEEYFSFAWVPIEQQIFFGRPSPELALKMLRESSAAPTMGVKTWEAPPSMDDDVVILKDYVASCLERTHETHEEDLAEDPFSCIWHEKDTEECYFQ